jgi:hypothetical protein
MGIFVSAAAVYIMYACMYACASTMRLLQPCVLLSASEDRTAGWTRPRATHTPCEAPLAPRRIWLVCLHCVCAYVPPACVERHSVSDYVSECV